MGIVANYLNKYLDKKFGNCPVDWETKRCLPTVHCQTACVNSCPAKAISIKDKSIAADKCIGCGSCTSSCPNGAFTLVDLYDDMLIKKIKHNLAERQTIRFFCGKSNTTGWSDEIAEQEKVLPGIKVQCLARLYSGLLLISIGMGADQVWLDCSGCDTCQDNHDQILSDNICNNAVETAQWLEQLGYQPDVLLLLTKVPSQEIIADWKKNQQKLNSLSRRSFFNYYKSGIKHNTAELLGDFAVRVLAEPEKDSKVPKNRLLLLLALDKLRKNNPKRMPSICKTGKRQLLIKRGCSLCNICSNVCPTGALVQQKDEETGEGLISFRPAFCIHCGICQEKCPSKQIEFADKIESDIETFINKDMVKVYEDKLAKCRKCKTYYPKSLGDNEYCPICARKLTLK